jgi:hypothetical protein
MAKRSPVFAGAVFNQWTAIRFVSSQANKCNRRWLCRCSCGNERIIMIGSIVSGHSKSCGCLRKPTKTEARINAIFKTIKRGSIKRRIPFNIEKSHIAALAEKQDWRCARTNIPLDLLIKNKKRPFGPTIDRIDNSRGYEPDNIQLVCNLYNFCKNEYTDAEVLVFAKALVEHSSTPNSSKSILRMVA